MADGVFALGLALSLGSEAASVVSHTKVELPLLNSLFVAARYSSTKYRLWTELLQCVLRLVARW
jgi:hypothetical protein